MVEEKNQRDWWWIGEQPGKWLESAVLASRQADDGDLAERARQILCPPRRAQEPGGYLGITDPAVRTDRQPVRGMDPYELYFMFHGLLTAAEEWRDARALGGGSQTGRLLRREDRAGQSRVLAQPAASAGRTSNTIICPQYVWVPEGTPKAPQL